MNPVKNLGHWKPFDRDKHNNPKPRKWIATPPLIQHDHEAALEFAEALKNGLTDTAPYYRWLVMRNAIQADRNAVNLRLHLIEERETHNKRIQAEIEHVQTRIKELEEKDMELSPEAERIRQSLGLSWKANGTVTPLSNDEPCTMAELAGRLNIPWETPSEIQWLAEALVVLGGGIVLGLSLGFLLGQLDLSSVQYEMVPFAILSGIGMVLVGVTGAAIRGLARASGSALYRLGLTSEKVRTRIPIFWFGFTILTALTVEAIESKVDQLGLFRALNASRSLTSFALERTDMLIVSLLLVVPIVTYFLSRETVVGYFRAAQVHLLGLHREERDKLCKSEAFGRLCELATNLAPIRRELAKNLTKLEVLEGSFRYNFSPLELNQIEDGENDAIQYSALSELVNAPAPELKKWKRQTFWSRLFAFFFRPFRRG